MARRFLTLKQWRELEAKHLLETEGRVKCLRCGGEKMIEKECECCGHLTERDCDDCDENGEVLFAELPPFDQERYLSVERYEHAVLADAAALANWIGRDLTEILVEEGFTPVQRLVYRVSDGVVIGFRGGDVRLVTGRAAGG